MYIIIIIIIMRWKAKPLFCFWLSYLVFLCGVWKKVLVLQSLSVQLLCRCADEHNIVVSKFVMLLSKRMFINVLLCHYFCVSLMRSLLFCNYIAKGFECSMN